MFKLLALREYLYKRFQECLDLATTMADNNLDPSDQMVPLFEDFNLHIYILKMSYLSDVKTIDDLTLHFEKLIKDKLIEGYEKELNNKLHVLYLTILEEKEIKNATRPFSRNN